MRWEVVEGFPYNDVYLGLHDALGRFFGRLFADFEDWHAAPNEFFEVDNRVIALGTYSARAEATGTTFKARFAHVWTAGDGVIVRLLQSLLFPLIPALLPGLRQRPTSDHEMVVFAVASPRTWRYVAHFDKLPVGHVCVV